MSTHRVAPFKAPLRGWLPIIVLSGVLIAACTPEDDSTPVSEPIRPVRVVTVDELPGGETATLTGTVEAQDNINLAFRIGGQLIERSVNIGDEVRAGQVVARLDAETARNAVDAARATVAGATARLVEARNTVDRYQPMVQRGFVARAQFDRAVEARDAAQAQVDAAEAQLRTAENQLSFTELVSDGPGTVTARGAEPGEVVAAGQMVVRLAREGGRDAVFDFPRRLEGSLRPYEEIEVALSNDPTVRAVAHIREISPEADPVTRTFRVRAGLADPPAAMRLGSTVTGAVQVGGTAGIQIPASALTAAQGQPAVWVLDPADRRVRLRTISVLGFELDRVLVEHGLAAGELVVTAGVQTLRPDQEVRLLGDEIAAAQQSSQPDVGAAPAEPAGTAP